jgi:hypothetical protein
MEKFTIPKDLWLRFGCFLSGHNYALLSECSEASKREVKKVTSALVIISLIWAIIGYVFSKRYLNFSDFSAVFGSLFMIVLIVQIERQIILTSKLNNWAKSARIFLAILIAVLGATIIDQYIFANDINRLAEKNIDKSSQEESESSKIAYDNAIENITNALNSNNARISNYEEKINNLPASINSGGGGFKKDPITGNLIERTASTKIANPQISSIQITIDKLLQNNQLLETQKLIEEDKYLKSLQDKSDSIRKQEKGFLDELNSLIEFIFTFDPYPTALIFYLIWFFFFVLIESLILIIKIGNKGETDYDRVITYQQKIREERLKILEQKRASAMGEDIRIDSTADLISNFPK